eukprot:SAG11_NODE_20992_length_434_cov_0.928358_1_plen_144_part_11
MLTVWVFMNLLIVTVLANFDIASTGAHTTNSIEPHDLDGFAHTWAALTIGVHRSEAIHDSSHGLLEQLKHTLEHHEDDLEADEIKSSVYEDGPPHLAGQLNVNIISVEDVPLGSKKARPYCLVSLFGTDVKGNECQVTNVAGVK